LLNFDINIYYNCEKNFKNDLKNFTNQNSIIQELNFGIFAPTEFFKTKVISRTNIKSGQDIKFFDKSVYLDWNLFSQNKVQDENLIDVVIEMIPIIENSNPNNAASKVAFYTLCKFTEENK
jgi:deoxyadenosine/deoxycytidine kinase